MNDIRQFVAKAIEALNSHALHYRAITGRGGCKDWAEYQYRVGRASGLEDAAKALDDFYQAEMSRDS